MPSKKKQHTVPRTYLANFADPASGKVWILGKAKIYASDPKDVLTQNYFYTIRFPDGASSFLVEDTLANIESQFSTIHQEKISKYIPLTPQERAAVAIFVATTMTRTKQFRQLLEKFFGEMHEKMERMKALPEEVKRKIATLPVHQDNGTLTLTGEDVAAIHDDIGSFHSQMVIDDIEELAPIIYDMSWSFVVPVNDDHFLTSDAPLVLTNPTIPRSILGVGLDQKDVELTLPLSSSIALLAGWKLKNEAYTKVPTEVIKEINRRTATHASELIIARSKASLEEIKSNTRGKDDVQ